MATRSFFGTCLLALLLLAGRPALAAPVFQTDLASISASGVAGVLRAGSIWSGSAGPLAALASVVDGVFVPANTQWTLGTYWWDEFAFQGNPPNPVAIEITLNSAHTVNRFVIQGDDNESYHVDYWDGADWQLAYTAGPVFTFGMETRDSGLIASVTSDRFRVRASGGDAYYSVSEIQAFDAVRVSEPGTLGLLALGFAAGMLRRRRLA